MARLMKRRTSTPSGTGRAHGPLERGEASVACALDFLHTFADIHNGSQRTLSLMGFESSLNAIVEAAVPNYCEWCAIDLVDVLGEPVLFTARSAACTRTDGGSHDDCCGRDLAPHARERGRALKRALKSLEVQTWPGAGRAQAQGTVFGLHVNDRPFGAVTFVRGEGSARFSPIEIAAAEQVISRVVSSIERSQLVSDNRDAVRNTQRIASQLHQLIAASITVTALRSEPEILKSLAGSTRSVFDAETAVVSLDTGALAPLRAIARRRTLPVMERSFNGAADDVSNDWGILNEPTMVGEWLVAPILEGRDLSRGVVAVRREPERVFGDEDREVLTLLAQMATSALGAAELSRTIQSSETRLRVLIETAPIGIVEADAEGTVRWWNRSASRVFMWPMFDDDSPDVVATFPADALPGLHELWAEVVRVGAVEGRDFVDVEIAGDARVLTATAALLPATEGEAPGILTLVDDVTNNRELMAELRRAYTMEMRGRVASRIAHDFNNLLTLILGYADILSIDLDGNDRALQMTREIHKTASRASMLTAQLQAIGRTTAPEPIIFNPVAVIQSNAELLERILGSSIELRWSLDEYAGMVLVDADQFEQAIVNLCINARDAMPEGGELSISVSAVILDEDAAKNFGVTPGKFVEISVADSGVGMDEETRARCFEPFFTTKGPFKGTGMGLASARRLAEGSNGTIVCLSELGVGTTFELLLPSLDATPTVSPVSTEVARPRGSATVLIADDDESVRSLMSRILVRNGYHVLEAESGERAFAIAEEYEGRIDLLLSDVVMGEMSGRDLAQSLQRDDPALLVLLVSGTADRRVIEDLVVATAAFLKKPFKPSQLIDEVHNLLSHRS